MKRRCTHSLGMILAAMAALASGGCETGVNPVLGTDRAFTAYGYFNPQADTQAVRVFTIDGQLERTSAAPIDAIVRSLNMVTGDEIAWRDSAILFSDDMFGHVFYAPFTATPEHRYRLTITRSDGAEASAEATVPPIATPDTLAANAFNFDLVLPVLWRDAPNLIDVTLLYFTSVGTLTVNYGVNNQTVSPDGRIVNVQFRTDTRELLFQALLDGVGSVTFARLEMRVVVTNGEWVPPDGRFDPNFLVEPGTFSNVDNGFGFIGAGYPDTLAWVPSDAVLRNAGFDPPDDG